ncbi:hypothetical protein GR294_16725 [Raoultella sp. Lac2]|uniref:Uncharacterized protein n=1 Tax=Klebsiella electrica TaxID=1259973 RepID=A0AAJ5QVJ0_9ENTR|nr:hypothetical protein [Klebsiella electrica]MXF48160.1 hypothetical protein [Raoultella sp. Lac2]MXG01823.1 hypothetical protein [Raoultella sp. Lac1]WBW61275.1 hypothetical protein OR613_25570 [Klebsiella electrica]
MKKIQFIDLFYGDAAVSPIPYFTMLTACDADSTMSEMSRYPAIFAGTCRAEYIFYCLLTIIQPT